MKKSVAIVVVLVVLLTGVPLVMAGPVMCADCDTATAATSCMVAILGAGVLFAALTTVRFRHFTEVVRPALLASGVERPPRFV